MKRLLTILTLCLLATSISAAELPNKPVGAMVGALMTDGVTYTAWSFEGDLTWTTFGAYGLKTEGGLIYSEADFSVARFFPVILQKSVGIFYAGFGTGLWHYSQFGDDITATAYKMEFGFQPLGMEVNAFAEAVPETEDWFTGLQIAFKLTKD